jgi:hypothetical protein
MKLVKNSLDICDARTARAARASNHGNYLAGIFSDDNVFAVIKGHGGDDFVTVIEVNRKVDRRTTFSFSKVRQQLVPAIVRELKCHAPTNASAILA